MLEETLQARVALIRPSYNQPIQASGQMQESSSFEFKNMLTEKCVVFWLNGGFKSSLTCFNVGGAAVKVWLQALENPVGAPVLELLVPKRRPPPQWLCSASGAFILFILLFIASWQSSWAIWGSSFFLVVVVAGDDDISGSVDWLELWSFISINRSFTSITHLWYTSTQYIYRQETMPSRRCSCVLPSNTPFTGERPCLRPPFNNFTSDVAFQQTFRWLKQVFIKKSTWSKVTWY